jgi:hypothetical protein
MTATLVRPLFDGSLDLVGDVHGEIDALSALLRHLGYSAEGAHPEGRRLVFVGDLVDRGPDSPAVVALVRRFVESERAQCVLGNHELNILLGKCKPDNAWFFQGEPAALAAGVMLDFFADLPLALERSDVRVVHACWNDAALARARQARNAVELHREARRRIEKDIRRRRLSASLAQLAHQNDNPVKLLTSGPEAKADMSFVSMGKLRYERRVAWWRDYSGPLCVFGHYWRIQLPHEVDGDRLFTDVPLYALLGNGEALCVDYSVGKRFLERAEPGFDGRFRTRLAALRLPERELIFDDGERRAAVHPESSSQPFQKK